MSIVINSIQIILIFTIGMLAGNDFADFSITKDYLIIYKIILRAIAAALIGAVLLMKKD